MKKGLKIKYLYIVLHHSFAPRDLGVEYLITKHTRRHGNKGVGHHWVIEGDAKIKMGRPINYKCRHAHHTAGSISGISICIVGDNTKPEDAWTDEQIHAGRRLINKIKLVMPWLELYPHSEFEFTECPGYTKKELDEMFLKGPGSDQRF